MSLTTSKRVSPEIKAKIAALYGNRGAMATFARENKIHWANIYAALRNKPVSPAIIAKLENGIKRLENGNGKQLNGHTDLFQRITARESEFIAGMEFMRKIVESELAAH